MSADSQWPLQQAVHNALSGAVALKALLGDPPRVFDHVPPDALFPYVVIGETTAVPFDTKNEDGMAMTLSLHTWSRYRGFKETKDIMATVTDVLDAAALSLTDHTLVLLQLVFAATMRDPDGLTRHGVQRFRALTQKPQATS
ncbi:MAG: DUF3168 domain-containing protein [Alphaproteobacteria bacterium]|nr:MAG: DUF3168 domain-containing protein [Alphaproteobacteria bacterium]